MQTWRQRYRHTDIQTYRHRCTHKLRFAVKPNQVKHQENFQWSVEIENSTFTRGNQGNLRQHDIPMWSIWRFQVWRLLKNLSWYVSSEPALDKENKKNPNEVQFLACFTAFCLVFPSDFISGMCSLQTQTIPYSQMPNHHLTFLHGKSNDK